MEHQASPDAVLLVHGTFAGSKHRSDNGRRWWQRGQASRTFFNWLNAKLKDVAACERVFHWSGENKEQERRQAGRELLKVLRGYEREGRDYHLVGHSHGGSVIWCALREAARRPRGAGASRQDPLPHLRSWTTVGTPFLTYGVRWSDLLFLVPLVLAGVLLPNLLGQIGVVGRYFGTIWFPSEVPAAHHAGLTALGLVHLVGLLLLLLVLYRAAGRLILRFSSSKSPRVDLWNSWGVLSGMAVIALGAMAGAHWGSSRLGVAEAVTSATWENRWPLIELGVSWAVVVLVFLYSLYRVGVVAYAAWMCARDHHADRVASRAFHDRGQCLWSREDEAINGLRTTLQLHDLRRTPDDGADDLDEPAPVAPPAASDDGNGRTPGAAAFLAAEPVRIMPRKGLASAVFAPLADQFFFEVLKQFLQGNDLVGRRLAAVTAEPPGAPLSPALPDPLQEALERQVTDGIIHVPSTLHRLRRVLGAVAYGGQLQSPFESGPSQPLPVHATLMIHTMYFPEARDADPGEGPPIPALIAQRIASRTRTETGTALPRLGLLVENGPIGGDGPTGHAAAELPRLVAPGTLERSRLKAALVPLTFCSLLSMVLLLPALAGPLFFDQVLSSTDEGRINAMVAAAQGVVHDAAADSEAFPYLADWACALADAQARGPLYTPGIGSLERRVVPPVQVFLQAAREAIGEIDDHHVRADASVQLAERLAATASPPSAKTKTKAKAAPSSSFKAMRATVLDLARLAVEAAQKVRLDYPDLAADVTVRAASVAHDLGDDQQAMTWLNQAGTAAIEELDRRFLKLRTLEEGNRRRRDFETPRSAPTLMNAPILNAPPAPVMENSPAQNRPPSHSPIQAPIREMPAPGAPVPAPEQPTTITQIFMPMVFAGPGSPDEAMANRLVPILLRASALSEAIDPKTGLSRTLVENLLAVYRDAEAMAAAKGEPSGWTVRFWRLGVRERLLLATHMKELGIDGWKEFRPSADEFSTVRYPRNPGLAWWALTERPADPIASAVSPAHALEVLGLADELANQVEGMITPATPDKPWLKQSPEDLVGYAALMTALNRPKAAKQAAEAVLVSLGEIRPDPMEIFRAGFSNELYSTTYQRAVDRHALRRIMPRLDLARLALANKGDLSPQSLIAASWDDALKIKSRAARRVDLAPSGLMLAAPQMPPVPPLTGANVSTWIPPVVMDRLDPWSDDALAEVSRASALAGVIATASHLDPNRDDTLTIQKDVLKRYGELAKDPCAHLSDEAKFCPPLGRALRHLTGAFARQRAFAEAETTAALIDEPRQRVSSRLLVASYQMRGTEDDRRRARSILEFAQSDIKNIERRRDRSPRLAEAAALWAMRGDFGRAIAAREECRLADRLQADATILGWFGLPPGATPSPTLPDLFEPPPAFDAPPASTIELLAPTAPALVPGAPAPMAPAAPVPSVPSRVPPTP